MSEEDDDYISVDESMADYFSYIRSVNQGTMELRHDCHGACNPQLLLSQYVMLAIDFGLPNSSWDKARDTFRLLLLSARRQIEDFHFCVTWTNQGPKRSRTYIRVSLKYPNDQTTETIVGAFFRGEQSHPVYGFFARTFGDWVLCKVGGKDITDQSF
jgi:hypothetical protein